MVLVFWCFCLFVVVDMVGVVVRFVGVGVVRW